MVSLTYEKLYRYCFTCSLISHEERDCPHLSDHQRQTNRERRMMTLGDRRGSRTQEIGGRGGRDLRTEISEAENGGSRGRDNRDNLNSGREQGYQPAQRNDLHSGRQLRKNLYQPKENDRTGSYQNPVWQCLGSDRSQSHPRGRETSIQSSSEAQNKKEEASGVSYRPPRAAENLNVHRSRGAEFYRAPPRAITRR